MKNLTSQAAVSKNTLTGEVPITILKVTWDSGVSYYGDRTFTLGTISVLGDILSFNPVLAQGKQDAVGEVSSASIILNGTNNNLKAKVNTEVIEGKSATVYQYFDGDTIDDLITVISGRITSDILWSDGDRTLSFEIETYIENNEIGFTPDSSDITGINPQAENTTWPMCFGTVLKVPAIPVYKYVEGSLNQSITHETASFKVASGSQFPQDSSIAIYIDGIKCQGIMSGDIFTFTNVNLAIDTNVAIAARSTTDYHRNSAYVLWIEDESIDLVRKFCLIGGYVNFCTKQYGNKVYFAKPWLDDDGVFIYWGAANTITETAGIPRSSWGATYSVFFASSEYIFYGLALPKVSLLLDGGKVVPDHFDIIAGKPVIYKSATADTYVFNTMPTYEVLEVFGYRNTQEDGEIFAPIPSSYYTKTLNGTIGGQTCSYLEFEQPIELLEEGWQQGENNTNPISEGWQGEVYVSLRSTVGPNGSDVIKYIINNYTNLTIDAASFASVRTKVASYLCNFAYFNNTKALDFIEDLAWQMRCALRIVDGVVEIIYLSEEPTADAIIDDSDILLKSSKMGFTPIEEVTTKIIATWKEDYSGRDNMQHKIIYKNNTDTYGTVETEREFFFSNIEEIVKKSVDFWGYRYSNIWRTFSFTTLLNNLDVEVFDTLGVSFSPLSANTIKGIATRIGHNSDTHVMDFFLNMASKAGDATAGEPTEDPYYWDGDPSNPVSNGVTVIDVGAGLSEVDYEIITDTNNRIIPEGAEEEGPVEDMYYIRFYSHPSTIQRGVNFGMTARLESYNGTLKAVDFSATIIMTSTDASDSFNKGNITFSGGIWTDSTCQITGGSNNDSCYFQITGGGYEPGYSDTIAIKDANVNSLAWGTEPTSVTRGTVFSVSLSGGGADETITITLNSTDSRDRIYDASGQVTTITLDGAGTYSASDWYIRGGLGNDHGTITANGPTSNPDTTSLFSIAGIALTTIEHEVEVSDEYNIVLGYLDLTTTTISVQDGEDLDLDLTMYSQLGTVKTDWNDYAKLIATDANGDDVIWLSAGDDASTTGSQALVNMVNGIWTEAACRLDVSAAISPITITAATPYPYEEYEAILNIGVGYQFVFTVAPVAIERGTNFTLAVEVQDSAGNVVTDAAPEAILMLGGTGVTSEVLNTTVINTGDWSSGVWTSATMQVTGGIGAVEDINITISTDEGILEDTVSFYITDNTSLYEDTDNNWTQGEAYNSPWLQTWTLFDNSASHGWRYEGNGIGWTVTTNASSLVARVLGPVGTEDVPLDVEINGVVVGQIVIRLPNSAQYTTILKTPILAGDVIRLKLTKSYDRNIYQIDHMLLFP